MLSPSALTPAGPVRENVRSDRGNVSDYNGTIVTRGGMDVEQQNHERR